MAEVNVWAIVIAAVGLSIMSLRARWNRATRR